MTDKWGEGEGVPTGWGREAQKEGLAAFKLARVAIFPQHYLYIG